MAALIWASSGSSRPEEVESASFGLRDGLAAVGLAGGFFWVSLRNGPHKEDSMKSQKCGSHLSFTSSYKLLLHEVLVIC